MKSKEVLDLLDISRTTLSNYVKKGIIRATKLQNGRFEYNEDDILKIYNNKNNAISIIYSKNINNIEKYKNYMRDEYNDPSLIYDNNYSNSNFLYIFNMMLTNKNVTLITSIEDVPMTPDVFRYLIDKFNFDVILVS